MSTFLFAPTPHDEAIDFIRSKPALSRAVFDKLLPELRARAFTIAGIEAADVLQKARDLVATLPAGGDWMEIKQELVSQLSPHFVDPAADEEEQEKQRKGAERRAELLIRVHGQQAYAATQYAMLDEQRDIFPYWQYLSLGDGHVRPTHQALDKVILPADHEFWQSHYPPWEFNCRCQVVPLTRGEVERQKAREKDKPVDQRQVLPDFALADLTQRRVLVRNGVSHNVSSPREKGSPNAYAFHPGDLRIPVETIAARYAPDVFAAFDQWARKALLAEGHATTVWDWLTGHPAPTGLAFSRPDQTVEAKRGTKTP